VKREPGWTVPPAYGRGLRLRPAAAMSGTGRTAGGNRVSRPSKRVNRTEPVQEPP